MAKAKKKEFQMNNDFVTADNLEEFLEADRRDLTTVVETYQELGWEIPEHAFQANPQVQEIVDGLSGMKPGEQVYLVGLTQLVPFPDQPFKMYPQDKLEELVEDIKRVGVLSPILVRKHKNKLQILAGHNRAEAARLAGLKEVPVLLLEADDDRAALIVTGTNLRQREKLLPSEKAFAYKMQLEALKRQGQRIGEQYNAAGFITAETGDSRMQIHRYIRLCDLCSGLLELLDRGKISMTPAVAVSYLVQDDQETVLELMREFGASLTIQKANELKNRAVNEREIGREAVQSVLLAVKPKPEALPVTSEGLSGSQIPYERIRRYLPKGTSPTEAEEIIIRALKAFNKGNPIKE